MSIRFAKSTDDGTTWLVTGTFTELATAADTGHAVAIRRRDGSTSRVIVTPGTLSGDATCIGPVTAQFRTTDVGAPATRTTVHRSRRRPRTCPTGGNCSSHGDGRSCGAPDCDGWE